MAEIVDLNRVIFIVMRELRRPVLALIAVYSIAILGMVLMPGPVVNDEPQYMSIFHAFYFLTYTATTTGFGEIPFEFSNAQRLWAIVCLYLSVVTWFYAIGSIIHLFQNPFFVRAVAEVSFSRSVQRIPGEFIILCGFGDTGSVLTRGLSDTGFPVVAIDNAENRIQALKLRNYKVPVHGLHADASVPKHLLEAGIKKTRCKALVAITNDEEINLKISAIARLLNPDVTIITMSKIDVFEDTLAQLGGDVHIVDPFKTFSKILAASMINPGFYMLHSWLVGDRQAQLGKHIQPPPKGLWVISGYGRMGHEMNRVIAKQNLETAVIDTHEEFKSDQAGKYVVGRTNAKTLVEAGIKEAKGILAVNDDDGHNLSILLNARNLNPELFTIVRQNRHQNEVAFTSANVDFIMQPSLVTARRILFIVIAPLLKPFFKYLLDGQPGRDQVLIDVTNRLKETVGTSKPHIVTIDFTPEKTSAVIKWLERGKDVLLGELMKHPGDRTCNLNMVAFVLKSGDKITVLPDENCKIREGDQLLYCGTHSAKRLFNATANSEYKLFYIQNGVYMPRSYLAQWYIKKSGKVGI